MAAYMLMKHPKLKSLLMAFSDFISFYANFDLRNGFVDLDNQYPQTRSVVTIMHAVEPPLSMALTKCKRFWSLQKKICPKTPMRCSQVSLKALLLETFDNDVEVDACSIFIEEDLVPTNFSDAVIGFKDMKSKTAAKGFKLKEVS